MERLLISDGLWQKLEPMVRQAKHPAGAPPAQSDRDFLEAVLYVVRTGQPWRDMPKELGHWHTVYVRYRRWEKSGVWQRLWHAVRQSGDRQIRHLFVDSTTVRAHHHAAGALKKKGRKPWDVLAGG
jgi:putative transposase